MAESREIINRALDLAATGAVEDACEALWPLVRDAEGREEALFTMACCFERANQLPPAVYLFGWVAERYPDFGPAKERLDRCARLMAERGLHEDFLDSGHVSCSACTLRYRAELPVCPYCGGTMGSTAIAVVETPRADAEKSPELLDQIGRDLERAWKNVQQRFTEFTERQDLSGVALRAQELAREARERTRTFVESDTGKQLKTTVGKVTDEAAKRARALAESDAVKKLARQSRDLGQEAVDRVKAVASREDVQDGWQRVTELGQDTAERVETWSKRDDVRGTWRSVYASIERFVSGLQQKLDRITGRKPEAENQPQAPVEPKE